MSRRLHQERHNLQSGSVESDSRSAHSKGRMVRQPSSTDENEHNFQCDLGRREVTLEGREIDLTAREFDLLAFFAKHPGRVFRRAELLDQVWGYGHEGYEHTVNSHINRLRSKIEDDPSAPRFIATVWGVGYKFAKQAAPALVH